RGGGSAGCESAPAGSWGRLCARRSAQGFEGGHELPFRGMERAHGELHSPYTDRDNGADLQQLQSDRPGCRHCQLRPLQSQPAQRLNEHIGEGGEPEPELVRAETVTGSPVGEEFELSVLENVRKLQSDLTFA